MSDFRTLTLKERLDRFPPFLCLALARVRMPAMTAAELKARHWNNKARLQKWALKRKGIEIPRRSMWRRITLDELSERAHIDRETVGKLAGQTDWSKFSVFTMLRFISACGIDLCHVKNQHLQIKSGAQKNKAFGHLNKVQMEQFLALAKEWKEEQ